MSEEKEKNYWKEDANQSDSADATDTDNDVTEEVESTRPDDNASSSEFHVNWAAHEYIDAERSSLWYVGFVIVTLAFIALDIFILKSYTFSAAIIVMAVTLLIYSRRPPREIQYTLSANQGLFIGERMYRFDEFKAFGIIKDGDHNSIMLIPIKRFSAGVSVYFPEEEGEKIVDILGKRLPIKQIKLDLVDTLVRRLRL
jgi:hypothetical protein